MNSIKHIEKCSRKRRHVYDIVNAVGNVFIYWWRERENAVIDNDRIIILNCVSAQSIVAHLWGERMVLFVVFSFLLLASSNNSPCSNLSSVVWCMDEHWREDERKRKKISVQYRLIVFFVVACFFFFSSSSSSSAFWMTYTQIGFYFFFVLNLRTRSCLAEKHLFLYFKIIPRDTSTNTWSDRFYRPIQISFYFFNQYRSFNSSQKNFM